MYQYRLVLILSLHRLVLIHVTITINYSRFCCTLGMCSYPLGNQTTFEDTVRHIKCLKKTLDCLMFQAFVENQQPNNQLAGALFLTEELIYKNWDNRCLAPKSHSNASKWRTYDMTAFRAASSKAMLNRVKTVKYDNYFNNWVNPKVLKKYTKRKFNTAWGKSYNFKGLVHLITLSVSKFAGNI